MIQVTIYDQSGSPALAATLHRAGWSYEGGPAGYWLDEDGTLQILPSVYDGDAVGGILLSRIVIRADYAMTPPPRDGWALSDNGQTLTIGGGGECLPAQSCYTIRTRWSPNRMVPGAFEMHGIPLPLAYVNADADQKFLTALRTGQPELYSGGVLPWLLTAGYGKLHRPAGKNNYDAAYGGGWGLEPVSGYARSPVDVLRADVSCERQRVWCVSAASGEPVANPTLPDGGYAMTRGWQRPAVLGRFCKPLDPSNPYDARVVPVLWNSGTCPYLYQMCGVGDFLYNGHERHDQQHLIRAICKAKAGWLIWKSKACKRFLDMVAQECLWAMPSPPEVQAGNGSAAMGRAYAWMLDALIAAGRPEAKAFVEAAVKAQMPNGQCMRVPYPTNWVPDPHTVSPDVPDPFPQNVDVAKPNEGFYLGHGFLIGAHPRNARLLLEKSLAFAGVVPRDFGVGVRGGTAFKTLDARHNPSNYDHCLGIGDGAWAFGKEWVEPFAFRLATPSQGIPANWDDARAKLKQEEIGRSQTVAYMAFAEMVS